MEDFSFVGNSEIGTIEQLYQSYLEDPESVDKSYQLFFKGFDFARKNYDAPVNTGVVKEFNVANLIHGYRQRGHLFTKTNPVRQRRQYFPSLDVENFGLEKADLEMEFEAGSKLGLGKAKLKDIIAHLQQTYCESVGVEYLYIRHPEVVEWLKHKMETVKNTPDFDVAKKKRIYDQLKAAAGFESFIHKKFVGQKRFSIEGSEVIIPGLQALINRGAELGVEEVMIGMAHRGRLNVLANILKKPYKNIFKEFVGDEYAEGISLGDVKYHLGYQNDVETRSGQKVRVNLAPNPSHLETVGPIIEGITRSKINNKYNDDYNKAIPVVIHGDAAIAAQGVVYEVIQMSQLKGYKTGGTIHIVINNQVGFTTNYLDARSSTYCTDVGKVTRSPVFHVNGDDAEAIVYALELAVEFRQKFNTDVFVDVLSYRKYGHNEGDEPRFTQPTLYKAISKHPNPRDIYADKLLEQNIFSKTEINDLQNNFNQYLEQQLEDSKKIDKVVIQRFLEDDWVDYRYPDPGDFVTPIKTGVDEKTILSLSEKLTSLPDDKPFFKKAVKILEDRKKMVAEDRLDWAMGELLAYATLVTEGSPVRLSGQDSVRGTFAHRHAGLVIQDSEELYFPLKNLSEGQAPFHVYNSLLSEYGVMGYEYGYALATPKGLTIWEAQFGDFYNVAQVIIDQYISSAEEKWGLMNGLVLFLPHGFEGQGPEHSSARIERFLSLAANNNMQVVNCTTPANFFHLLRRQVKRDIRIPLVAFTPKSLLRHPKCTSKVSDIVEGGFEEVIDDDNVKVDKVKRVVFCSGKIYYDLLARKEELDARDIALIRIEQLHPFPKDKLDAVVAKYKNAILHLWVQEEPENMGAWKYIRGMFKGVSLIPVARLASGSPATGLNGLHMVGQKEIVDKIFKKCHCELHNKYCGLQCVDGKDRKEILKQHKYFSKKSRFSI
ncbi:2-oxoglutarate dehydrogenase E1 component [Plebeiibacterium sediminum]|uniref:oxoglutarate dehydrogenase (succinyl-transferring) n=1 Tax=Plebeiibacterium sediminum TaxID=2992112 RepID=A0AAE3M151_9BACT|nr:2-oxoglutarate dehydrogenase E1 component [Plebeiobacterium sediminum]MCW3785366.1 2-oxoglutarate dehydrogenase E1 component [Plebeiobacterium sediminum]